MDNLKAKKRHPEEIAVYTAIYVCAAFSVLLLLGIIIYVFAKGARRVNWAFLTGVTSILHGTVGIAGNILNTLIIILLTMIITTPIGVGAAIYLNEYAKPGKLVTAIIFATETLAGIPSIIYGFFGLMVIVPVIQDLTGTSGKGVLTASIMLGIMILPTIISVSESSLRAVPESYYEGSLALGATHEKSVFFTMVPAAKSGIMAGIILGIGRAIGETMAVVMVAGNQAVIPESITSGVRTMTINIVLEMGYAAKGMHRDALIATAVVLFVFILLINISFSLVKRRDNR